MAHSSSRLFTTALPADVQQDALRVARRSAVRHIGGGLAAAGPLRRVTAVIGDVVGAMGVALCVPLVILAVGIPIALCVRLLLWIGRML
jgi:hypothetical protein